VYILHFKSTLVIQYNSSLIYSLAQIYKLAEKNHKKREKVVTQEDRLVVRTERHFLIQ